jgi:hypothetical protein
MKAMVVYESMFGNTRLVAQAVADGIARHGRVEVIEVGKAGSPPPDLDLLVLGGPTHAFGLSRPGTRQDAARQVSRAVVSDRIGLREWIALAETRLRTPVAVFDTKVAQPRWLPGSAARSAAKRLRRLDTPILVPPESFYVTGALGPLVDGELARARHWGDWVARLVAHDETSEPAAALRG